jgi:hypothetical protein
MRRVWRKGMRQKAEGESKGKYRGRLEKLRCRIKERVIN